MGTQLPPEKRAHWHTHTHPHPIFGPCLLWPNGWMDQDATWYGGKPRPRRRCSVHVYCGQMAGWMKTPLGTEVNLVPGHIVLDGDPAPPQKGHSSLYPLFGLCLMWPWSPISAAAELLFSSFHFSIACTFDICMDIIQDNLH